MEKEFFSMLADIFEMDKETVDGNTKLSEDLWDSVTILAVSAAIDSDFDVIVPVKDLETCKSVQDILNLIEENK